MSEVVGEKKKEIISKISEKINEKNINNKEIFIYINNNETHLILKKKLK